MSKKFILFAVCLLGFLLLFLIDRWQVSQWRHGKKLELQNELYVFKKNLKDSVDNRFNALKSLSALFILNPDTSADEFSYFASLLMEYNPPIRALQYADENTKVVYVYPPKGNEITIKKPMVLKSDPKRAFYVKKAIESKEATVQGPFRLRQGGRGIVVRQPVFKNNNFLGLTIGVYDFPLLITEALGETKLSEFVFRIKNENGKTLWKSGEMRGNPADAVLTLRNITWKISAGWKKAIFFPLRIRVTTWGLGLGFLLSLVYIIKSFYSKESELQKQVNEKTNELRKNEERFRSIVENAPDPIFIQTDGKFIYLNPAACRLFGVESPSKIIGESVLNYFHPDFHEKALKRMKALSEKGESVHEHFEQKLLRADGTQIWVETAGEPIEYDNKLCGLVFVRDITDRKEAEKALVESEKRFMKIANTIPGVLYDYYRRPDGNNKFLYISPQCKEIFECEPEEVIQNSSLLWNMVHAEDIKYLMEEDKKANAGGNYFQAEVRIVPPSGVTKWIQLTSRPDQTDEDKPKVWSGVILDITQRKEAEKELYEIKNNLEKEVEEKTRELKERVKELEHFRDVTVEREMRMHELREEIKRLKKDE
ncbi:putative PAS/PAC sensor protein [Flexistipes sinusarabici DSM 4947]|uniref:histidine kinase n=2 Tax=Flexistipes sinusarabici TaxID=2352 RepID=F8E6D4_FLESM|nr:PAS domain S-box protein [Flexistipes sinusarabici]AEI15901.1 putative PAS/PAC sensor protein [Flexistipes sinusarabici DSM 4947]